MTKNAADELKEEEDADANVDEAAESNNQASKKAKKAIRQLKLAKKNLKRILFDLKDGALERTRPSRYEQYKKDNAIEDGSSIDSDILSEDSYQISEHPKHD